MTKTDEYQLHLEQEQGTLLVVNRLFPHTMDFVDVSDPTAPSLIQSIDSPALTGRFVIVDDFAYFPGDGDGLNIMDISDPSNPFWINQNINYANNEAQILVIGTDAYVGDSSSRLLHFDISDPYNHKLVNAYTTARSIRYSQSLHKLRPIQIIDNLAYIGPEREGGFDIINLDIPDSSSSISTTGFDKEAVEIQIEGNTAYVAHPGAEVSILDIGDPMNPILIGSTAPLVSPEIEFDIQVADSIAFVACEASGLHILDLSDPLNPLSLATCNPGDAIEIEVVDTVAYLTAGEFGLHILDIDDPSNPTVHAIYALDSAITSLSVSGNTALVSIYPHMLSIDVSDPENPVHIGTFEEIDIRSIETQGDIAYISTDFHAPVYSRDILTVDIHDPSTPVLLGSIDGYPVSYTMKDSSLYYTNGYHFYAIDTSLPNRMQSIGRRYVQESNACAVVDDIAYIATGANSGHAGSLQIIDISDSSDACIADFNLDDVLNPFDLFAFIEAYTLGYPSSDLNDDGVINFFDVSEFLAGYLAGCP